VLAPAFHRYLIPCPPQSPSPYFEHMQQRVTIMPQREGDQIVGTIIAIEDVTARRDEERQLADQLTSTDEAVRARATRQVVDTRDSTSGTVFLGALSDMRWHARRTAASNLAQSSDAALIDTLMYALRTQHQNPSVLNSVLQVLALTKVDVVPALIASMESADPEVREYTALALGQQRDRRAVPMLLRALDDPDVNVRYYTIEALGQIRAAEAVDRLLPVVETRDFFLTFPALDALALIGDPRAVPSILPLLEDELLQAPAIAALGALGDAEIVGPLVALLDNPNTSTTAIAQALEALQARCEATNKGGAHIPELVRQAVTGAGVQNVIDALPNASAAELPALAQVLGWLNGPLVQGALVRLLSQPAAREEAVDALVGHGAAVTDLLIEQLAAEDSETSQAAAVALGRIGDARAVPALLRLLDQDVDLAVAAAGALGGIGDPRAFEALIGLIGSAEPALRQATISALNSLGHADMPDRIAALLRHPDASVRESAVKIAGYFGYAQLVEALLACCADDDERVRSAAVEHLPYLEDPRVLPVLVHALGDDAPRVRAAAARAFGQVEPAEALPHLLAAARDPDPWVRYYVAHTLGRHRYTEATQALTQLARTDPATQVRVAAIKALGKVGGPGVVPLIRAFADADNADIAQASAEALAETDEGQ
jgi:HEAT repeat protein